MLARLLRLLVPLTPRRHPRLFPIFRRGRFQTGLFRSRRPHPNPSPRPRTQPLQRRPAAPSQPQSSSPTRQKIRPKLSLASLPPLGAGWREIAPPSPPPNSRRPAHALSFVRPPRPPVAVPARAARRPAQASPHRPGKTSPTRAPLPSRATPRSVRRRAWPGASRLQPKYAPPRLKSFLEKTLIAREAPACAAPVYTHRQPQPAPHRPARLHWHGPTKPRSRCDGQSQPHRGAPPFGSRAALRPLSAPGVERVQLSARNRRLRDRPDCGVHVSGQQHRRGLAKPRRPASNRPLRSR